ncbi:MAG: hypothetical protein DSM106950_08995 [Stigonema ocellatum SAG 48.90 = DSM 106950]|nr:hypothetical protein [Stigonema ocellatum SAG 48.90 = DSM 106950]
MRTKKRSDSSNPRVSRFSEVLGAAHESSQKSGYPDSQPSEQSELEPAPESSQKPGYPNSQQSEQQPKAPELEKLAKRENPDYTQTTFRIPKKLSRQINRALMDLADEGVEMDRSDLLEELAGAFIRLADEVGAVEALEQFKKLGIQVDE